MRLFIVIALFLFSFSWGRSKDNDFAEARKFILEKTEKFAVDEQLRYIEVISNCSIEYNLPVYLFSRQVYAESKFKWWDTSDGDCWGPMQVSEFHWSHKLYKVDNGKLGIYLNKLKAKGEKIEHKKYLCRIGYGIEVGAMVMRHYLDIYKDYKVTLIRYSHRGDAFQRLRKNPDKVGYVNFICNY